MKKDTFNGCMVKKGVLVSGAYVLTHVPTGKFYVGSTLNYYKRRVEHIVALRSGSHHVKALQELYDADPCLTFRLFLTGVGSGADREVARAYEQTLLDEHWGNPLLLNTSRDAVSPLRDKEFLDRVRSSPKFIESLRLNAEKLTRLRKTKEHRDLQSRISKTLWADPEFRARQNQTRCHPEFAKANSEWNKAKWADPGYKARMLAQRNSTDYKSKMAATIAHTLKPVSVFGTVYPSRAEAARQTGLRESAIARRIQSAKYPDVFYVQK